MPSTKEDVREWNKNLTKEESNKSIDEYIEDGKIVIESKTQRVNITISSGLWRSAEKVTSNRSRLMEKLLREYLEKFKGKDIILRKPII